MVDGSAIVPQLIDGGMAVAIPSPAVRERTLTVHTDVPKMMAVLRITSAETISTLLVALDGQILWRSKDAYDPTKGAELAQALAARAA